MLCLPCLGFSCPVCVRVCVLGWACARAWCGHRWVLHVRRGVCSRMAGHKQTGAGARGCACVSGDLYLSVHEWVCACLSLGVHGYAGLCRCAYSGGYACERVHVVQAALRWLSPGRFFGPPLWPWEAGEAKPCAALSQPALHTHTPAGKLGLETGPPQISGWDAAQGC